MTLGAGSVAWTVAACTQYSGVAGAEGVLLLPVIAGLGFFVTVLLTAGAVMSGSVAAVFVALALAALIALPAVSAWAAIRARRGSGRWPGVPVALALPPLAAISAVSTLSFCYSMSA